LVALSENFSVVSIDALVYGECETEELIDLNRELNLFNSFLKIKSN
jgi:hypothetical protein